VIAERAAKSDHPISIGWLLDIVNPAGIFRLNGYALTFAKLAQQATGNLNPTRQSIREIADRPIAAPHDTLGPEILKQHFKIWTQSLHISL
jgi:hypothetical protein